ncbi:hypothetical protein HGRIS_000413 [Hohenbuehelia grisea]|uniref:Cytochrome P450 n=1 Tax=Hohenbuehelia grisea TaxID=104357 RepID=A0ABR3JSB2_9AGAR
MAILSPLLLLLVLFGLLSLRILRRILVKSSVTGRIRGPPAKSFLLGHFLPYYSDEVGAHEFKWQEAYGAVYRIKALLGEDRLMVSDAKALQYMYQSSSTKFVRPTVRREFSRLYLGRGIAWSLGDDHKRHRKILAPAFTKVESRGMLPFFRATAGRLCHHWETMITESSTSPTATVDVADWLSRAALDALGDIAFDYQFDTLENADDRLAKAHCSLLVSTFGLPTPGKIFAQHFLTYMPMWFFKVLEHSPSRSLKGLRNVATEGNRVAKELVDRRLNAMKAGTDGIPKDIMSILVQANASETPTTKLSMEELYAEMRTIMVAGHETTGCSMAFMLYELAKHHSIQEKVRSELLASEEQARAQGRSELSNEDMDSMPYFMAVIKETLRIHPVAYGPFLECMQDDVLPLSKPIRTIDGQLISEIPVRKGQILHASLSGYNRLPDIWGPDPHTFRPERWLDGSLDDITSPFGVYANLGNFASGAVACLGWRFA